MAFKILQILGGLVIAIGYLPQILRIFRTRSTGDLSLKSYATVTIGVACVELYAVNMVLVYEAGRLFLLTNTISLCLLAATSVLIAVMQAKEKRALTGQPANVNPLRFNHPGGMRTGRSPRAAGRRAA
jgi:MtN3 and saliva related transmembrane protein